MTDPSEMSASPDAARARKIRLRYPATCASCSIALAAGTKALHDRATKRVTCLACGGDAAVDAGEAGASAAAEAERRERARVEEARRRHGDHAAAVAAAMASTDHSVASWAKGADGERRLAAWIEREVGEAAIPLYDRLIPGLGKANIDLLYVTSSGVWVVDAKDYKGKLERQDVGPFWREDNRVRVGGRDRTSLADGVEKQVKAVLAALSPDPALTGTPIEGALCFVGSEWGLLDRPFRVGQVWVLYPAALRKRLRKSGPIPRETMERIARRLDLSFPRARP